MWAGIKKPRTLTSGHEHGEQYADARDWTYDWAETESGNSKRPIAPRIESPSKRHACFHCGWGRAKRVSYRPHVDPRFVLRNWSMKPLQHPDWTVLPPELVSDAAPGQVQEWVRYGIIGCRTYVMSQQCQKKTKSTRTGIHLASRIWSVDRGIHRDNNGIHKKKKEYKAKR